jgi:hypothetical protein
MNYSSAVKTARMTAVRDAIDGGSGAGKLEIGTSSLASVLATITLNDPSGTISGSVLTLSGFPKTAAAAAGGKALAARIRDSADADCVTDLTVGLNGTVAPAWVGNTAYTTGLYRANGVNIYKCVTGGTSAASGGPTGTGTGITDGTAEWDWYCLADADIQMDNLEINSGQNVTINASPAINHF